MTRPLRSRPVMAAHRYYGSFRPCASLWRASPPPSVLSALWEVPFVPFPLHRLDKLDAGETTGSKVPYLSLFHARAALRPEVVPVVNRTPPTLLPGPK